MVVRAWWRTIFLLYDTLWYICYIPIKDLSRIYQGFIKGYRGFIEDLSNIIYWEFSLFPKRNICNLSSFFYDKVLLCRFGPPSSMTAFWTWGGRIPRFLLWLVGWWWSFSYWLLVLISSAWKGAHSTPPLSLSWSYLPTQNQLCMQPATELQDLSNPYTTENLGRLLFLDMYSDSGASLHRFSVWLTDENRSRLFPVSVHI